MKKRIVGLVLIIAIFITMLGLIIGNAKYVFSSQTFYTQFELEQEYENGYNQGSFENRDEALYEQLNDYVFENLELKVKNETLQNENEILQDTLAENEELKAENEKLKITLEMYKEYIESLGGGVE